MDEHSVGVVLEGRLYEAEGLQEPDQNIFVLQVNHIKCQVVGASGREVRTDGEDVSDAELFACIWRRGGGEAVEGLNGAVSCMDFETTYSLR